MMLFLEFKKMNTVFSYPFSIIFFEFREYIFGNSVTI